MSKFILTTVISKERRWSRQEAMEWYSIIAFSEL